MSVSSPSSGMPATVTGEPLLDLALVIRVPVCTLCQLEHCLVTILALAGALI